MFSIKLVTSALVNSFESLYKYIKLSLSVNKLSKLKLLLFNINSKLFILSSNILYISLSEYFSNDLESLEILTFSVYVNSLLSSSSSLFFIISFKYF